MMFLCRDSVLAGAMALALLPMSVLPAELAPAEKAAIFAAAGFKPGPGGQYVLCQEETPTASYTPGQVELVDLNGDGQPEAWITETSMFCYGSPHTYFALVRKDGGAWRKLLEDIGIPVVLETRHQGWPDIEVGGPGFDKFPYYRWDGKAYVRFDPQ